MATEQQVKIISNIASDLVANKTVFFVGAGFSIDLDYPGWGKLLTDIIEEHKLMDKIKESNLFYMIPENKHKDFKEFNELLLKNLIGVDFLRLAGYVDLLLERYAKTSIRTEIVKQIERSEQKRQIQGEKFQSYKKIFQQLKPHISEIITTNYDTNLEHCLGEVSVVHRNLKSINSSTKYNPKEDVKLYKIHGCINDESNEIVITEKDYQEFNRSNTYLFNKLYSTFMENNIVFIGYSLSDPNIRSLLKEIIDETKKANLDVKKKVYWINRDKVNEIDKAFYNRNYSVQIIDEIELKHFLQTLNLISAYKVSEDKTIKKHSIEIGDELIRDNNQNDPVYILKIDKVIGSGTAEEVLKHIYKRFNVDSGTRVQASAAFFKILARMDQNEAPQPIKSQVIDILSVEDNHLLSILKLIEDDPKIEALFADQFYSSALLSSLISRSLTINDFDYYKEYSIGLLTYYRLFNGNLMEYRSRFVEAFYSVYRYMTQSRSRGYSFMSLNDVKKELKLACLDYELVQDIISVYPFDIKNEKQKEQIRAIINHLEPSNRTKLYFSYILKPVLEFKIYRLLYSYLQKNIVEELEFKVISSSMDADEHFIQKDETKIGYETIDTGETIEINFYVNDAVLKIVIAMNKELNQVEFKLDDKSIYLTEDEGINKEVPKEFLLSNIREFIVNKTSMILN